MALLAAASPLTPDGAASGRLSATSQPGSFRGLSDYLENPLVRDDERLRLRVLIIKGETDEDLDPSLSQRSWTEALALAPTSTLREAAKEGSLGYQAELTLRLASIAFARKETTRAQEEMSRAAEFARAAGGNRILATIALERAKVLRHRRVPVPVRR
jgi:hypothetical protein